MTSLLRVTRMAAVALVLSGLTVGMAAAHDGDHASPEASPDASPEASPVAVSTGAAYMVIANAGDEADRLIGGETGAAETVEIHEVADDSGVMTMRPLPDGLEIPAGETVELEPGGHHLMLVGLTGDLTPGETFELTLEFEHAGKVMIEVAIHMGNEAPEEGLAEPVEAGDLVVEQAWSRGAPGGHSH